jgi:hypothetical protein
MTPESELRRDARRYLSVAFSGIDASDIPWNAVQHTIEATFPGGWDAYSRDFYATRRRLEGTSEALSPVKAKIRVKEFMRLHASIHLGPFDEVISADFGTDSVKIVLSIATVKEYHREDRVVSRSLQLWDFTIDPNGPWKDSWKARMIECEEATHEAHRRFGYINTPERNESRSWQEAECYRPGTKSTPMDGPIRKLEMSHEEVYGKVTPPTPSKKNK